MKTYGSEPGMPSSVQVGISELVVSDGTEDGDETLKSYGLGSCLAIALYDPETGIGGLAHAMLPDGDTADHSDRKPGKYADTAIRALLRRMVEQAQAIPPSKRNSLAAAICSTSIASVTVSASETSSPPETNSTGLASQSSPKTSVATADEPSNSLPSPERFW